MSAVKSKSASAPTNRTTVLGCVCILLMTGVVLAFAPSYRADVVGREVAVGSDFFQEWIGATIISRGEMDRLYDWQYSRSLQHDVQVVGFEWPESEYYPMVYPPFYYWLLQPLSWTSCLTAARLWCMLNGLAFAAAAWLLSRELSNISKAARFIPLLILGFAPVLLSLNMGQKSGVLCLIFSGTYVLLRQNKSLAAGGLFGCILFKPQLAIVMLLAMLLRRDWRFLLGFAATGCLFGGVTLLHGVQPFWDFVTVMRGVGSYMNNAGYQIEDAHNLWCVIRNAMAGTSKAYVWLVFTPFVAFLFVAIARSTLRHCEHRGKLESMPQDAFSLWMVATLLLSPHLLTYDLSLLFIPMCLEFVQVVRRGKLSHSTSVGGWGFVAAGLLYFGSWWSVRVAELAQIQITTLLMMAWCLSLSFRLLGHGLFALRRSAGDEVFQDTCGQAVLAKESLIAQRG